MEYGFFDDKNREYVITEPRTPWPWINYLGTEDFFSLISNTAGGYSFCKDAKFRRITRYRYNNVPMDSGGKYFYINDGKDIWNPGWKPCKTRLDSYECRHGMNYTKIVGSKNGIEASVLYFVPLKTWAEVQKVTLTNTSTEKKNIKLFSFVEWCLWNAATDMENFQRNFSTGEVEIDGSTIYHKTEYKERRNHYAYYSVNAPIQGTAADIIKIAMIRISHALKANQLKATMNMQVHDELNFSVPPHEKETIQRIVIEEMQAAAQLRVPLIADCGWGENWLEAH